MKLITTNLLNRFWKTGIKPIKTLIGSTDISKIGATVTAAVSKLQEDITKLNTDLGSKVSTNDARLSDARTPKDHNHDSRYYTEAEINNLLDCFGTLNPRANKIIVGSTSVTFPSGATLASKEIAFEKNVQQFMPFMTYNDSTYHLPVFLSGIISGKNAGIRLVSTTKSTSSYTYLIWYFAVITK